MFTINEQYFNKEETKPFFRIYNFKNFTNKPNPQFTKKPNYLAVKLWFLQTALYQHLRMIWAF